MTYILNIIQIIIDVVLLFSQVHLHIHVKLIIRYSQLRDADKETKANYEHLERKIEILEKGKQNVDVFFSTVSN